MAAMEHRAAVVRQPGRDERLAAGDEPPGAGLHGLLRGIDGDTVRGLLLSWAIGMSVVAVIILFNVLTRRHDFPGQPIAEVVVLEGSSLVSMAPALLIAGLAALWLRRSRPSPLRMAAGLALAFAPFALVHIGGFVLIRQAAYAAADARYHFTPLGQELAYELAKDAPGFAVSVFLFWVTLGWIMRPAALPAPATPATFDIRDGARLIRVPVQAIVAIRSAGNYAEFLLDDGRRPLMRTALGGLETLMSPLGFVRTHRSWLVNAARVTGLAPEGSGDYAVEIGELRIPLSRRYRTALQRLRAG